jgi:formamidase
MVYHKRSRSKQVATAISKIYLVEARPISPSTSKGPNSPSETSTFLKAMAKFVFPQVQLIVAFCGAIEMAGIITLKFSIIPSGVSLFKLTNPIFFPGPVQPHFGPGRYLTFEGISVDEKGKQHYLDVTIAYRQAVLNCIRYLKEFGYSEYQIYLLLSTAPVEGHVAGVVDGKTLSMWLI